MSGLSVEVWILSFGYLVIFSYMLLNGICGLPPSPVIYLAAGALVLTGKIDWIPTIIAGTLGTIIGNLITYEAVRRNGLPWLMKFTFFQKYLPTIVRVQMVFAKKGLWIVVFGKFLPVLKAIVPIVAGVAKMRRLTFVVAVSATGCIWAVYSVGYGYYLAKAIVSKDACWVELIGLISLPIAVWWFVRYIKTIEYECESVSLNKIKSTTSQ